jgi:hypothetical protein
VGLKWRHGSVENARERSHQVVALAAGDDRVEVEDESRDHGGARRETTEPPPSGGGGGVSGKMAGTLLAVIRSVVFLLGLLFGLLYSMLIGLASAAAQFVGVFGGLGLAIAAPLCWSAATRSNAGDRITLMYVVAWIFMIAAMSLVGLLEKEKVVQTGTHGGVLALCLVAAVYLVAVPLVVHRYRQREEHAKPKPLPGPPWE